MAAGQRHSFSYGLKNTPQKQFEKRQAIIKLIILISVFCIVFIPSMVLYMKVYSRMQPVMKEHGGTGKVVYLRPEGNHIDKGYTIGIKLSKLTKHGLIFAQIAVGIMGLLMLGLCGCYINNHVVFTFSMFAYVGIMFNGIDACNGGAALDYFKLGGKYQGIEYGFLWPSYLPALIGGNKMSPGTFNLPDIFLSIGIYGLIVGFPILGIIEIVKFGRYKHFIYKTGKLARNGNKKETL